MSNGADRFFDEMLANAKSAARKDVAQEVRGYKAEIRSLKKQLTTANKATLGVAKRERACRTAERKVKDQLRDISLAEQEINFIMNKIDKVRDEKVTTKTTTVRSFASGSRTTGWYGGPTPKARALASIRRRVNKGRKAK